MTQPTNRDFEFLSAYLDGELSTDARAELEARLAADPDLQAALDDLRGTVQLLKATPTLAVPRNFTLDPVKYRRPAPWWTRYRVISFVGAMGAFAAIILIALGAMSALVVNNSLQSAPVQSTAAAVLATNTQVQAFINSTQTAKAWTKTPTPTTTAAASGQLAQENTDTALAESPTLLPTSTALPTRVSSTALPTAAALPTLLPPTQTLAAAAANNSGLTNGNGVGGPATQSVEKASPGAQGAADQAVVTSTALPPTFAADELDATMTSFAFDMTATTFYMPAPQFATQMPFAGVTATPVTGGEISAAGSNPAVPPVQGGANEPSQVPTQPEEQTQAFQATTLALAPTSTSTATPTGTPTDTPTDTPTVTMTNTRSTSATPLPTRTTLPTRTAPPTESRSTSAKISSTATLVAAQPTNLPPTAAPSATIAPSATQPIRDVTEAPANNLPRLLIIIGLTVLIFSAVLLGIGWARSRL